MCNHMYKHILGCSKGIHNFGPAFSCIVRGLLWNSCVHEAVKHPVPSGLPSLSPTSTILVISRSTNCLP